MRFPIKIHEDNQNVKMTTTKKIPRTHAEKVGVGVVVAEANIQSSRDTAAAKARGAGDHNGVKNAGNEVSEMSVQVTKEKNNIMICEM